MYVEKANHELSYHLSLKYLARAEEDSEYELFTIVKKRIEEERDKRRDSYRPQDHIGNVKKKTKKVDEGGNLQ